MKEFKDLLYHNWRQVAGEGGKVERPSVQPVKVWTWNGFDAVETEGTVFERAECMPAPDPGMRCQRGFYNQKCHEARNTPNLDKPTYFVFSVPCDGIGYSNPFRDYYINSPNAMSVYRLTRENLLDAVYEIVCKELKRVAPEYERLSRTASKVREMLEAAG